MMTDARNDPVAAEALNRYLDEVSAHMGPEKGRRDMILELRSAILDHAEELGGGEVHPEAVDAAIAALGEPALVASAYTGNQYLIGPRLYRPFLFYTSVLFAVHMVLILVASVALIRIEVFPITVLRIPPPFTFLSVFLASAHALLLDLGLMVVLFATATRVRRTVRLPQFAFRVRSGPRHTIARVVLTILILLLLNPFRDRLFVLVLPDPENAGATIAHSLFSAAFVDCLLLINAYLVVLVLREGAYLLLGELRALVASDALICVAGVALMIWLLAQPPLLTLAPETGASTDTLPLLDQLLGSISKLILAAFAVGLAVSSAKRFFRLGHLWR